MSPSLKRLIQNFSLKDSFRSIHPTKKAYSRFYDRNGEAASRIDRSYTWGNLSVLEANYTAVAFSDHMGYIVKLSLPDNSRKFLSPKSRAFFKTRPEVVMDNTFKNRLKASLVNWLEIKERGLSVLK